MSVRTKTELLQIAEICIQLRDQGFNEELREIGVLVKGEPFLDNYFFGSVRMGVAELSLSFGEVDNHTLRLPFQFGEENLPAIVDEYRQKVSGLIERIPEIKEQKRRNRIAELERELEMELV